MAKAKAETKAADQNGGEDLTPEQKLSAEIKAHGQTKAEYDQILLINADMQNRLEEMEAKLVAAGQYAKGDLVHQSPADVAAEKPKVPTKSFKHNGEDHVFTIPQFINPLDGQLITSEQALHDKDLMAHLGEIGFGGMKRKADK